MIADFLSENCKPETVKEYVQYTEILKRCLTRNLYQEKNFKTADEIIVAHIEAEIIYQQQIYK